MITGDDKKLKEICQTHQCPEHGRTLGIAWHAEANSYVIRCAENHYPEEVTPIMSKTKQYKQGEIDAVRDDFNLLPSTDLATDELLGPVLQQALISYANRYGLDAYRGHVVVMYGKPYIGIDGYLFHARQTKKLYRLISRPLTEDEFKLYKIDEANHAWIAKVEMVDTGESYPGLGVVTQEEMTARSSRDKTKLRSPVVAAHPWQLAQKRAEWQAMRRAFPIGESQEAT